MPFNFYVLGYWISIGYVKPKRFVKVYDKVYMWIMFPTDLLTLAYSLRWDFTLFFLFNSFGFGELLEIDVFHVKVTSRIKSEMKFKIKMVLVDSLSNQNHKPIVSLVPV